MSLLISLNEAIKSILSESFSAGFYTRDHYPDRHYPRLQILTIDVLLDGKRILYPSLAPTATFQKVERKRKVSNEQQ
jgi:hypothetical protein